jgi:hypothetical protein
MTSSAASAQAGSMPRLSSVTIYYLTRSQTPVVTVSSPSAGDIVSGKTTVHWSGADADHDTLSYSLFYSADDGKTYSALPHVPVMAAPDVATAPALSAAKSIRVSAADVARMKKELDQQPEIPDVVKAQMLQQAAQSGTPSAARAGATDHLSGTSLTWDSHGIPDGSYRIKVAASDYQSEPADPRTGEGVSGQFLVVNTAPVVTLDTSTAAIDAAAHVVTLHGLARASLDFVKSVQYTVDGGKDAYAAIADSGIFDSVSTPFMIVTLPLKPGTHRIVVQAQDQAGNMTSATAAVTIP